MWKVRPVFVPASAMAEQMRLHILMNRSNVLPWLMSKTVTG